MPPSDELLSAEFMARLEQLSIVARRVFPGQLKGEKRSPKHGSSVEFADFRSYTPGDDFRYVDWNIFGRLDKLFLKLFREEEDLHLYLLLDASRSMQFGEPLSKLSYAAQVAAALGFISLTSLERVAVWSFSEGLDQHFRLARGRHQVTRLLSFLSGVASGSGDGGVDKDEPRRTSLSSALREFVLRTRHRGVVTVLSDFLDPGGYHDGLLALLGGRFDVNLIQVLAPEELQPQIAGDLRLKDSEFEDVREITVSGSLLAAYKQRLEAYCGTLRSFATARGCGYALAPTIVPADEFVLQHLRRGRIVE